MSNKNHSKDFGLKQEAIDDLASMVFELKQEACMDFELNQEAIDDLASMDIDELESDSCKI